MTPYYSDEWVTLYRGDSLAMLPTLPDASLDAVVTDPPYGLEFMGKDWDSFKPREAQWNTGTTTQLAPAPTPTGTGVADATPAHDTKGNVAPSVDASGAATRRPARAASAKIVEADAIGGFQDGNGGNAFSRSRVRTDTRRHGGDMLTANQGFQQWCQQWATECYRVLKPGGHLLAFGGTRTSHRLVCAIEDAGFEIRDSIGYMHSRRTDPRGGDAVEASSGTLAWVYGSGFP
jgi:hypothetical protein